MRILLVSGIFPPDIGGPASYVPRLATYLLTRGHQVTVVTLAERIDGHAPCAYPVLRIRRGLRWPLRVVQTTMAIARAMRQADVVSVNGLYGECLLASWAVPRPLVAKVVGDSAWERARNRGWFTGTIDAYQSAAKSLRLRLCDVIRTLPLRRCRRVIVPSAYLAGLAAGWGMAATRLNVVPNAVEAVPPGAIRARRGPLRLVTVCRLTPWKGVDGILRALAALPGAELTVVGDGPERAALERLAGDLGITARVRFAGQLAREQALAAMAAADVFVLNSTYEGLPHVVLEAMASGTPVVASAAGGTPEVVEDGVSGLLVPPGDDRALIAALGRIADDEALAQRLAAAALERLRDGPHAPATMFAATARILHEAASCAS